MPDPVDDRAAYLLARQESLRAKMVASPWTRQIFGPQRGHVFRDIGARRIWARNNSEKLVTDISLIAAGFRLLAAPTGCAIE